jgi:O-antigen/teichoic acid export membrane protein
MRLVFLSGAAGMALGHAGAGVRGGAAPGLDDGGVDRSKAARSVLWSLVENGGLALVSFASLVVYSRFLTAADFGVFSIVLAVIELLEVCVSMLFHDALVQRKDATPLHFDTAFTFTVGLSLALFASCALLAPAFAGLVHTPIAAGVFTGAALRLPCTAIAATIVARQRRELAFRTLAVRSLVGRLSGAALGIVLVLFGAGVWGLVAQQVLISFMGSVVLWIAARDRPRFRFGVAEFRQLIGFGASAAGVLLLSFSVKRVFMIVVGVRLGNAAAGYLNLSFRAVDVLWAIAATAVTQVALPILARLQSDPERLERAYRSALEFTCLLLYPCFVGIAVVAPEVVALLFGPRWLSSSRYVTVLALLILIQAPRLLVGPMLTAVGRPRDTMVGIAVEMTVILVLMSAVGATTLPWAVAIWASRELATAPVMAALLQRATGIRIRTQLRGVLVPFLASAAMAAAVCATRRFIPAAFGPGARMALLVPAGAASFLSVACLIGRPSINRVVAFVSSAARPAHP